MCNESVIRAKLRTVLFPGGGIKVMPDECKSEGGAIRDVQVRLYGEPAYCKGLSMLNGSNLLLVINCKLNELDNYMGDLLLSSCEVRLMAREQVYFDALSSHAVGGKLADMIVKEDWPK